MGKAAYAKEQAEHCFRLARRARKVETAQNWIEFGNEYLAKARQLEAEEWPGSEAMETLVSFCRERQNST